MPLFSFCLSLSLPVPLCVCVCANDLLYSCLFPSLLSIVLCVVLFVGLVLGHSLRVVFVLFGPIVLWRLGGGRLALSLCRFRLSSSCLPKEGIRFLHPVLSFLPFPFLSIPSPHSSPSFFLWSIANFRRKSKDSSLRVPPQSWSNNATTTTCTWPDEQGFSEILTFVGGHVPTEDCACWSYPLVVVQLLLVYQRTPTSCPSTDLDNDVSNDAVQVCSILLALAVLLV